VPKFSIIVLNWNGKHFLETCLLALRHQTYRDFETILVDNGSQDGSVEYVQDRFPEVQVVALKSNVGFCSGNLEGYRRASGEIIALLNNDTEAHPRWVEEMNRATLEFPDVGSFASKMLYFDDREKIENCGFHLTTSGATVDLGRDEKDGPAWSHHRVVFGACAGAGVYRRSMLNEIGFLDADFFMTYEDVDLSFRAQLLGYQCLSVPDAIVYHRYRATMECQPDRQVFFSQRNIEFVYFKNMPCGLMLRFCPQRLLYEIGAAIYFLFQGNARAYLKGKIDALRHLPALLRKRNALQARRVCAIDQLRSVLVKEGPFGAKWRKFRSGVSYPAKSTIGKSPQIS